MRHQVRNYKSSSLYLNKENKENTDLNNLPIPKQRRDSLHITKLEHKPSISTTMTVKTNNDISQELKVEYSLQIAIDYAQDIMNYIATKPQSMKGFLEHHTISSSLRSKMVDWMIEVLSSYKMTEQTFFRSVSYMDIFLKHSSNQQETKDLHLIGVTCMFMAAKYEEIHPFKLSVIYDKIARKKFTKQQILNKESQIIAALNFELEKVNIYDFVKQALYQIDWKLQNSALNYLKQICLYLSKMVTFSSELVEEKIKALAASVIFIGLKTLEQSVRSVEPQEKLPQLVEYLNISQDQLITTSKHVLDLAKNFSKVYPNLSNLKKFNKFQYRPE